VLVLDMIEILPPLGKYKCDTWRILPVKCYIDNSVHLQSCIGNVNNPTQEQAYVEKPKLSLVAERGSKRTHPGPVDSFP
jgi:hypothetical protein